MPTKRQKIALAPKGVGGGRARGDVSEKEVASSIEGRRLSMLEVLKTMEDTMVLINRVLTRPFVGPRCYTMGLHLPVNLTKRWRSSMVAWCLQGTTGFFGESTNPPRSWMLKTRA
ncbi:hypothetical protein ACSQ67_006006 [Phaseolus vulgaris]